MTEAIEIKDTKMESLATISNDENGNQMSVKAMQEAEKELELIELNERRDLDRHKQLEYLLKQAEIHSHFIERSEKPKPLQKRQAKKRKLATKTRRVSKRRRRAVTSSSESANEDGDDAKENSSVEFDSKNDKENQNHNDISTTELTNIRSGMESGSVLESPQKESMQVVQFDCTPNYIEGEMRDYQIRGLNWLVTLYENGVNGILADEMGLGKTIQTISFMGFLKHYENINGPFLVIVPNSTVIHWIKEIERFCPALRAISVMGDKDARAETIQRAIKRPKEWDVCVTSYEICIRDKSFFKKFQWRLLVIDEGHRIKNENTVLARVVRSFSSSNRLLLTGTPLQNSLHELWAMLNFLLPHIFKNAKDFDTWFDSDDCLAGNNDIVQRLHTILRPFMLRRIKADVEKSLLPKKETKLFVGLTTLQRDLYRKVLIKDLSTIIAVDGKPSRQKMQMVLMPLRKAAIHPYLIDGVEEPPYVTDETIVKCSGKMMVLDKLLEKLKSQNSRVVLFSQFTSMLDILEDYLNWREYKYCRLDGNTKYDERAESIDNFNAKKSDIFIFLLSTRAGGLGINLATANTVIVFDSDWNPQADLQAIDRVHRIGQTQQVRVFRLITEKTADERIVQRAEIKQRLDRMVIQNRNKSTKPTGSIQMDMIRFGAEHILSDKCAEIMDVDIDKILVDGETKTAEEMTKLDAMKEGELNTLTLEEASSVSVYQFEGIDFRAHQKNLNEQDILPERRVRKPVNYRYKPAFDSVDLDIDMGEPVTLHKFQFYPNKLYKMCDNLNKLYLYGADNETQHLYSRGFYHWTKQEFDQFCEAVGQFGRNNLIQVASRIPSKSFDQVRQYNQVFWVRGANELSATFKEIESKAMVAEAKLRAQKAAAFIAPKKPSTALSADNSDGKGVTAAPNHMQPFGPFSNALKVNNTIASKILPPCRFQPNAIPNHIDILKKLEAAEAKMKTQSFRTTTMLNGGDSLGPKKQTHLDEYNFFK